MEEEQHGLENNTGLSFQPIETGDTIPAPSPTSTASTGSTTSKRSLGRRRVSWPDELDCSAQLETIINASAAFTPGELQVGGSFLMARPPNMRPSKVLFLAVFLCLLSPLLFGFSVGFTSPAQSTMLGVQPLTPQDLNVFSNDEVRASTFAAIINVGCMIGALLGAAVSDKYGRRPALLVSALPMIIAWSLIGLLSDWILLSCLRFLMGIGVGMGSAVAPCYIGEVSTLGLRGMFGAMNQLSITIGIFGANLFGTFVFVSSIDDSDGTVLFCEWRHLAFFCAALSVAVVSTALIPESPRFCAMQGDLRGTRDSLKKLRVVTDTFDQELLEIVSQTPALRNAIANNPSLQSIREADPGLEASLNSSFGEAQNRIAASFNISGEGPPSVPENQAVTVEPASNPTIRSPLYRKSLIVGVGLMVFQQLSGANAVIFYVSKICHDAGFKNAKLAGTGAMGANVLFTLVACLVMEKAGRRFFLILSMSVCSAAHFVLAIYFYGQDNQIPLSHNIALMALATYIIGFSLGLGPIPWLMLAELFPTEVRSVASSIAISTCWACSFLVTLLFQPLEILLGKWLVFFVLCCVAAIGALFVFFLVPETRGKNIDEVLTGLNGQWWPCCNERSSAEEDLGSIPSLSF